MNKTIEEMTSIELARELFARCNRGLDRRSPEFHELYEKLCAKMKAENEAREA